MPTGTQSIEKRESDFLMLARKAHGDKFDYSKFAYVNAKDKSIIICPVHGEFEQTPDKHLSSKHGCMECWLAIKATFKKEKIVVIKPKRVSKVMLGPHRATHTSLEMYLSKLNLPEGLTVEIVEYESQSRGIVILHCVKHGPQKSKAVRLLKGQYKCSKCGWEHTAGLARKGYESFLEKAREIHGDRYTYPDASSYVDRKSVLTINCSLHGDFQKKAQKHLSGQGCNRCRLDRLIATGQLTGGYDGKLFAMDRDIAESPSVIYYLKVGDNWKIGITRNRLGSRLAAIKNKSKATVETLDTFDCTLEEAYELEQLILNDFAQFRVYGSWSTELFCIDVMEGVSLEEYFKSMLRTKEKE